ncbi:MULTISPECIES: DUF7009 family protein [unclassified Arenibacter]|uniref:DUF7009 family protein n=1 Tax=unclassified Arenibacter TaxID=2615047 RepID=UPI000E342AEB|nr:MULTISPECIES: hypothetical protein [unclassified Arenibacter]MCM4162933.1 hypothetical protein [Arenibacter sp. A80]RFT57544.1 hypothetical protein D0S24_04940 [Arenibacter sp. P308M17]
MKIRIKGNSIRYRLTKTEVEAFCKVGFYEEQTGFKDQIFKYVLRSRENISHLEADFKNGTITMYLPEQNKKEWANSELVGFQHSISIGKDMELHLLLEKDFVCLDETVEDQSDNYPNPLMGKKK